MVNFVPLLCKTENISNLVFWGLFFCMYLFVCVYECECRYVGMRPLAELDCLQCFSTGANGVNTPHCFISCTSLPLSILYFVSVCEYDVQWW